MFRIYFLRGEGARSCEGRVLPGTPLVWQREKNSAGELAHSCEGRCSPSGSPLSATLKKACGLSAMPRFWRKFNFPMLYLDVLKKKFPDLERNLNNRCLELFILMKISIEYGKMSKIDVLS